jgi:hypothetical protein
MVVTDILGDGTAIPCHASTPNDTNERKDPKQIRAWGPLNSNAHCRAMRLLGDEGDARLLQAN